MTAAPVASASLYVGDLHPDVTEPMLFEVFSQVGPVASIRVCRDAVTRRSLGYAYVNFNNVVDAERALDTLNYSEIREQPCRIMWKQRDPSMRKTGVGNVFIKFLDKTIDNRVLNDTFSAFGNIISCKVGYDEHGVSKGYGYVQYETQEEADRAIAKVNGMLICNKKVLVGRFLPKNERDKLNTSDNSFTNIYVKNLDLSIDDAKLKELFSEFGSITSAVVMRSEDNSSKGFGFVNFETHEMASAAIAKMHDLQIGEKKLFCCRAEKKRRRELRLRRERDQVRAELALKYQGVNLYIKNLDDSVNEERLRLAFAPFGTITSTKIMTDEKGVSKGFGFVCFSTPDEATKAVTAMNTVMFASKPLYVALHQTKEVRRAQLQAQFAQRQKMNMQMPSMGGPMPPGMTGMPYFFPPGVGGPVSQRPGMYYYQQPLGPAGAQPPRWTRNNNNPNNTNPMPMSMAMPGNNNPQQRQQRGRQRQMQQNQPGQPILQGAGGVASIPRRGPQTFKYAPNVRNRDQAALQQLGGVPTQVMPMAMPMVMPMPNGGPGFDLTAASLAALPAPQQKQLLGERLYAQIAVSQPELAGKITGMLLELDNSELLHLLVTADALHAKIEEALVALNAAPTVLASETVGPSSSSSALMNGAVPIAA